MSMESISVSGQNIPFTPPARVGPLGSTGTVRNELGCGNVSHKIIFTAPQQGQSSIQPNAERNTKRTHARYTLTVHKLLSLKLFFFEGKQQGVIWVM